MAGPGERRRESGVGRGMSGATATTATGAYQLPRPPLQGAGEGGREPRHTQVPGLPRTRSNRTVTRVGRAKVARWLSRWRVFTDGPVCTCVFHGLKSKRHRCTPSFVRATLFARARTQAAPHPADPTSSLSVSRQWLSARRFQIDPGWLAKPTLREFPSMPSRMVDEAGAARRKEGRGGGEERAGRVVASARLPERRDPKTSLRYFLRSRPFLLRGHAPSVHNFYHFAVWRKIISPRSTYNPAGVCVRGGG